LVGAFGVVSVGQRFGVVSLGGGTASRLAEGAAGSILAVVIERIVRVASSFEEADALDRQDVAAMSFEERISGVERLRRVWFGEGRAQSLLTRVLERADLPARSVPPDRRSRRRRAR
jgi:hypothetical protein